MKRCVKMVLSLAFAVFLLTVSLVPAFADGSSVTYDGNAGEFIFAPGSEKSPTDLFTNFKNVMPGDTVTQTIVVKNDSAKRVNAKIYLRALGAEEGSEKFLSQLRLTVEKADASTLFEASADKTAGLQDWNYLGTLLPGADVTLNVTLEIPAELGNEFQNAIGMLDWQFKVEEFDAPHTGDDMIIWPYALGLAVCVTLIVAVIAVEKRKQHQN